MFQLKMFGKLLSDADHIWSAPCEEVPLKTFENVKDIITQSSR